MKSNKLISMAAAMSMAASAFGGMTVSYAADSETVYNFSELTEASYNKSGVKVFNDALNLKGTENMVPLAVNAAISTPCGETQSVKSALKTKKLEVTLHLDAGQTVVEYYCGSDSAGAAPKALDMVVKDAAGNVVATEANVENKGGGVKPYIISYTAVADGDYTVVDSSTGTNRTIVYAVAVATGEYKEPSTDVTPATATQDPSQPTNLPATAKPTVDPNGVADVSITRSEGSFETAYITWTNPTPVDYYNVYVKPEDGEYTKIDNELTRYYGSYYRADAIGLKAGNYQMKVEPVIGGKAQDAKESELISVKAHTREGFAFDPRSPHYHADGVGAYKNDGTLKDGAQVVYITDKNKDSVKFNVVTDKNKGTVTECTGLAEILAAREKNNAETTPLAIRMIGQVESPAGKNSAGYIQIKSTSNITFEGVGSDATTYHWSFLLRSAENVEVRNLAVMEFYDDGISLDTANYNCWVHNCDIFYGQNRGGDQKKGDGSLDVKSGSDYCTFSYNHFWDSGKSSLCGMKVDSYMGYHVTYHHNWFDHSDSRHPRVRGDQVHVYNNYYDGNSKYGVGACTGSSVFVEKNVFRNCLHPVLISQQGTDISGDSTGTFSGEDGGMIKMFDNLIYGGIAVVYSADNATEFDAYKAETRDEQVPDKVIAKKGGNKYSNFDTASDMYAYTATDADKVVDDVKAYAGRIDGGDFTHTFNDEVDDASYDRDPVLGNALQEYKTSLDTEYATGSAYPSTGGEQPTPRPSADPFDPSTQPTQRPNTGEGGGTSENSIIWRASDAGGNIAADTVLKDSWLTLIGGGVEYKASNKSVGGVAFTGKVNAPSGQIAPTLGDNGQNGSTLKITPDKDGTIKVYIKLNSGKTFYITDANAAIVTSYENATTVSEYTAVSAEVKAGETYYAFGGGTNAEYWGAEYISAGGMNDPADDDPSPSPSTNPTENPSPSADPTENPSTAPSVDPTENPSTAPGTETVYAEDGVVIVAEYDGDVLKSVKLDGTVNAGEPVRVFEDIANQKVFVWNSLEGMKSVAVKTASETEPTEPAGSDGDNSYIAENDTTLADTLAAGTVIYEGTALKLTIGEGGAKSGTSPEGLKYIADTSTDAAGRITGVDVKDFDPSLTGRKVRVAFEVLVLADGELTVSTKVNSTKQVAIVDAETNKAVAWHDNQGAENVDEYQLKANVTAGKIYYIGGVGTSPYMYSVSLAVTGEIVDPPSDVTPDSGNEPTAGWAVSAADNGCAAGTELMPGLTTLFLNTATNGKYISGADSGNFSNGEASGTALKYAAAENGVLSVSVIDLGAEKALSMVDESGNVINVFENTNAKPPVGEPETKISGAVEGNVTAGSVYYIYGKGTKVRFTAASFTAE